MRDVHGAWVWYELLTGDTAGAKAFYEAVVDWSVTPGTEPPMFYGSIEVPDGAMIGGIMPITDEMAAGGARPTWLGYIAVDAIDAAVAKAVGLGAKVLMPRVDMEGVGSFAMIADPDGAPLYLMEPKPTGDYGPSTAFSPHMLGRCGWNELAAGDAGGAIAFYTALFDWSLPAPMDMGPMGKYQFISRADGAGGETPLGAIMKNPVPGAPPHWNAYFRVADIDKAAAATTAAGGAVLNGPHQVPTGDWIVHARDPQGASFCLVGARPA